MESIWKKEAHISEKPAFSGERKVRAAVIGGGMAGILTAHYLKKAGIEVLVLEAAHIGDGQTKNTTAKVTAQHGAVYDRLIREIGEDKAQLYAHANRRAVEEYRKIVKERDIPCHWQECAALCYSERDGERMRKEAEAERKLGFASTYVTETELPFPVKGAARMEGQACFSPLIFLYAMAEGLEIYENTPVGKVELRENGNTLLHVPGGSVEAEQVIFATHYPMLKLPGLFVSRIHQERSYVLALRDAGRIANMYISADEGGRSVRGAEAGEEELALLGGCNHRTGGSTGGRYDRLREAARRFWPECGEAARWSAQDCMTLDGIPYIGRASGSKPDWFVATGFGKWGMSHSMVSALLLTDLILGKENPWEAVFTPQRFGGEAAKSLTKNMGCVVKGLVGKKGTEQERHLEDLLPGEGQILKYGNGKIGAYRDEKGELHLVQSRCPHMGCELAWNPDEKSWDCPCHGSRFGFDGRVLDGPAVSEIGLTWER